TNIFCLISMDNHPIPQDVTGFQFKLIGNMTVKQFAYVAIGVVLAVLCYYLKILGFTRFLLMFVFGVLGLALSFLPVEGRPLDVMLGNFIKALISPNQYIFGRVGGKLAISTVLETRHVNVLPITQAHTQLSQADVERQKQLKAYLSN